MPFPVLKAAVALLFFAGLGAAWWLDHRAPPSFHGDAGLGFRLEESAAARGIDFVHLPPPVDPKLENIAPHVAGVGAAVSIADVNGDGFPDLYATTSAPGRRNALYVNRGDGTFDDAAAAAFAAPENSLDDGVSMGSVFGDVDNDGDLDLYLYKWGYPQLFLNRGDGTFEDRSEDSGLRRWGNVNAACFLDYDGDGLVDLYACGYFRDDLVLWRLEDTRIMQESFEFARNGGHNRLYRNLGGGRFEDVTEAAGVDSTRWTMAVAAADFDGDGRQDLWLANDYGPEELFLNRDGARFELATGVGLGDDSKSGMAVALGDVENRGALSVYVTNISRKGYLFQGNNLRSPRGGGELVYDNVADGLVANCGWSWGAQFGDLDNDGWQDLYVVNGFISADPDKEYWYAMSKIAGGLGAFFEDARNWPPIGDQSLSGYERSRLLQNREGRGFRDVAEQAGVTDRLDGRAVAFADLSRRGALDVVVANQKGPLLVYANRVDPARHWIQLRLIGTRSNRAAIGARATVVCGDRRQAQVVAAGSGFASQNDLVLHFGLGESPAVDAVEIAWPSGVLQRLEAPAADRVHVVTEPRE